MNQMMKIQNELKQGATINEVCYKYNMTFKYLMEHIPNAQYLKPPYLKKTRKDGGRTISKNITERNGKYYLRKTINKKHRSFGTYNSLEDAERVRDYCDLHGWKQRYIDIYCQRLGIVRCKHEVGRQGIYTLNPEKYEDKMEKLYKEKIKPRLLAGEALSMVLKEFNITNGVKYHIMRQLALDDGYKLRKNGLMYRTGEMIT